MHPTLPLLSAALLTCTTTLASPAWHCPAEPNLSNAPTHTGGSLILKDANTRLERIRHHIDVHIEDGFARTTIDQTYFNTAYTRQEGTYYIPLPPDASISRLAMYVNGQLMEGGMAEEKHARQTYEKIVRSQRDPVLLEWIDGSTFKMRVFPIEAREHKSILLSYTQRLPADAGKLSYHFPGGDAGPTREWSAHILVKGGARTPWKSATPNFTATTSGGDLVLESTASDTGIALTLDAPSLDEPLGIVTEHDGHRYALLRYHPDLGPEPPLPARNWIVLFEASADRDPVAARLQIEALRMLMARADEGDRFTALVANTTIRTYKDDEILPALEQCQLIGALDLGRTFAEIERLAHQVPHTVVLHLGGGNPSLGERNNERLAARLPRHVRYLGAGIGNDWNRTLMEAAADRGSVAGVRNPDDILPLLRSVTRTGWKDLRVEAPDTTFLPASNICYRDEDFVAYARLPLDTPLPETITFTGAWSDKTWRRQVTPKWITRDAGYLPRAWAKAEINRLVALDPLAHRNTIVALSKQSHVMSPFTSLIVLESLKMHRDFGIEPGGKDHWALYPAPEKMAPLPAPDFVREREARKPGWERAEPFFGEDGMTEIPLEFPKPMFVGTPVRIDRPNLERLDYSGTTGPAATVRWRPMAEGKPVALRNPADFERTYFFRRSLRAPRGSFLVSAHAKVTSSETDRPIIGELDYITDGDKDGADGSYVELGPDIQWVQIDLGKPYELWGIALWHFHKNARAYDDVIVQLSDDPGFHAGVTTLFNNDHDNSSGFGLGTDPAYIETNHGRILDVPGTTARYLRLYSNGNTANELNHYIEVEAWGRETGAVRPQPPMKADSLAALEERVETEWRQQAGVVDLKWLRTSHTEVLAALLEAAQSGPDDPSLLARGRHFADRWWGIDGGSPEACRLAAKLMRVLDRADLEWAYLTTPVAVSPEGRVRGRWEEITAYAEKLHDPALAELARREATP